MFERFTDRARRVIALAQEESRLLRHHEIGTEHLLLGLLHDEASDLAQAMAAVGVTLSGARAELENAPGRSRGEPHGHIPFTPRAKRALEHSVQEAERLGHNYVAPPHLLLAVLRIGGGRAVQILVTLGVDLAALAATLDGIDADSDPDPRPSGVARAAGGRGRRLPRRLHYGDAFGGDAILEGLVRYGRHEDGCDPDRGCSCGLQLLIDWATTDPPPHDES